MMGPLMSALVNPFPFELLLLFLYFWRLLSRIRLSFAERLLDRVEFVIVLFLDAKEFVLLGDFEKDLKKLPREPEFEGGG